MVDRGNPNNNSKDRRPCKRRRTPEHTQGSKKKKIKDDSQKSDAPSLALVSVSGSPAAPDQTLTTPSIPVRLQETASFAASTLPPPPVEPSVAAVPAEEVASVRARAPRERAPAATILQEECRNPQCRSRTTSRLHKVGKKAGQMCWLKGLCNKCYQAQRDS